MLSNLRVLNFNITTSESMSLKFMTNSFWYPNRIFSFHKSVYKSIV